MDADEIAKVLAEAIDDVELIALGHGVELTTADLSTHLAQVLAPLVEQARQEGAREALRRFADSRGINVGDEDDDYWRGYRQAQRECLRDAIDLAERAATPGIGTAGGGS